MRKRPFLTTLRRDIHRRDHADRLDVLKERFTHLYLLGDRELRCRKEARCRACCVRFGEVYAGDNRYDQDLSDFAQMP